MRAIEWGRLPVIRALLTRGAAVNSVDARGGTALILTVAQGKSEAVKLLVEKGSDIHVPDKGGWTAVTWVMTLRKNDVMEMLQGDGNGSVGFERMSPSSVFLGSERRLCCLD